MCILMWKPMNGGDPLDESRERLMSYLKRETDIACFVKPVFKKYGSDFRLCCVLC